MDNVDELHPILKEYFEKGLLALEKKNYVYAKELFNQAINFKTDFAQARHYLHLVLAKEAETHPASLLVKIWNKIAGLPFIFAALLEQIRELTPQSLKAWEKALAVQPKSIFILNKIAQNLMEQRDPQSAFLVYEEINQLEPLNLSALKNLANLSLQLNQQQKARQYYEKILNVLPHDLEAERGLKNLDALGSLKKEV